VSIDVAYQGLLKICSNEVSTGPEGEVVDEAARAISSTFAAVLLLACPPGVVLSLS
jgi:hypothetical protein